MTWHVMAACAGLDPDLFMPERGDVLGVRAALAVCATCPVVDDCLAENLEQTEGIFGGTTGKDRRLLRRTMPKLRSCLWCGDKFRTLEQVQFCSSACGRARRHAKQAESAVWAGDPA